MVWPRRLWECSGKVRHGLPLWASRERTLAEERAFVARLNGLLPGPADELEKRLVAGLQTDRDDSRRPELTATPGNCPTGNRGSHFTFAANAVGRPANAPPVYAEHARLRAVAEFEFFTGKLTRHARRLVVLDTVRMLGVAATAQSLDLTPALVREMVREVWPIRIEPARHGPRFKRAESPPLLPNTAPLRERARELWFRGYRNHDIPEKLQVSKAVFRALRQPRQGVDGPCVICANSYRRQPVRLTLGRCPHYSVVFRLAGAGIERVYLDKRAFRRTVRKELPKQQVVLPAFKGGTGFRWKFAARLAGPHGPRTLESHFAGVLRGPEGKQNFKADANQWYAEGASWLFARMLRKERGTPDGRPASEFDGDD